ncbi:uncharacterized protein [Triticum aestivum]|nr:uncharacterized protein LOC123114905 [Triticum aestivum]
MAVQLQGGSRSKGKAARKNRKSHAWSRMIDLHAATKTAKNIKLLLMLVVIDRQLFDHLSATKMKIGKAPALLKKAAAMCKSKTGVFTARLLVLAAVRRRMATVGAISHRIHALIVADWEKGAKVDYHKALMLRKVEKLKYQVGAMVDPSHHLALFDQEDGVGGCPDWTLHPIFSDGDDFCYTDEYDRDDDDGDEPSVMNAIRINQEADLEFNMDDDIDLAAEMFIRRFREQMNESFL